MQKYLSFLVVFFFFLSLSAGWGEDLCENQTCSGHGECQDDGENEWCLCDDGYIADGMECILGCNGITCSGHGSVCCGRRMTNKLVGLALDFLEK